MVFPLTDTFTIENGLLEGKLLRNHRNPSKISVPTVLFDWYLSEKMPIAKEISNMLDLGPKAIASNFHSVFASKKFIKDKCYHCAMASDYSFRWLSTAPSYRIIALWVNPFTID